MTARRLRLYQPDACFCFGRDALCRAIVSEAFESKCLLLFGGRLSGKTTVLLRIAHDLAAGPFPGSPQVDMAAIAVYADLMLLGPQRSPSQFFHFLGERAYETCKTQLPAFALAGLPSNNRARATDPLSSFLVDLEAISCSAKDNGARLLFLIDEAKQVLGETFSRSLQDNLFSVLYGGTGGLAEPVAFVFSGAQELNEFFLDETSPLGSRAATKIITNLELLDVISLVEFTCPGIDRPSCHARAGEIFAETGGHAGLTAALAIQLGDSAGADAAVVAMLAEQQRDTRRELMRLWAEKLSPEARALQPGLLGEGRLTRRDAISRLQAAGLSQFRADRALDEFLFTGVARRESGVLAAVNRTYWNFVKDLLLDETVATGGDQDAWNLIEETELTLRRLVGSGYQAKWPGQAEQHYRRAVGDDAWNRVLEHRNRHRLQYPLSSPPESTCVLDFCYLGQLGQMMLWGEAWGQFRHLFRDKRQLEDLLEAICPVRTDQAHFRPVPRKELERCRLACDDLLAILGPEKP